MLIVDQLRKGDRPLQALAGIILAGLVILLGGLWYVQVIAAPRFRSDLKIQSFRTVRVPAVRGKIFDRNHVPLAENRPSYNVNLYLEELRANFREEYTNRVRKEFLAVNPGRSNLTKQAVVVLERSARFRVVSNLLHQVSVSLQQPLALDEKLFQRHYDDQRSLPLPLMKDLTSPQVAAFMEQSSQWPSLELDVQPVRAYPRKSVAAHVLGYLRRNDDPGDEEDISFKFRLPDQAGVSGVEKALDRELRGRPGVKSVLVNSMAYRQREEMLVESEAGRNIVLTLDLTIQEATEKALSNGGPQTRGAAVVMEVRSGDILAMASSPTFDPNVFLGPIPHAEWQRLNDPKFPPWFNNAAYGRFQPGSIFKIIVGLAGLESGILNPDEIYHSTGEFILGGRSRPVHDTAGPGEYDFEKAFYRSSNPYFIEYGIRTGPEKIIEMGRRFRLGERTGLPSGQETSGYFPPQERLRKRDGSPWMLGDTANFSIGQGEIEVTPLQMVVMTAAVANGGSVLQPRLVSRIEPQDGASAENVTSLPSHVIRNRLGVGEHNLEIVRKAMLADVENPAGTGRRAHVPGFQVCGKTGTAQTGTLQSQKEYVVWFVSFAPFEDPRYAVAVVVAGGSSGGGTCAPIAQAIYQALLRREQTGRPKGPALVSLP